jgi:hypothetical protein
MENTEESKTPKINLKEVADNKEENIGKDKNKNFENIHLFILSDEDTLVEVSSLLDGTKLDKRNHTQVT